MSEFALGLIETRGKLAAIEAADVALKSANVALCDVENATGALITVKVIGDVGAVKAAIDAAKAKASLLGEVIATRVIPRPAPDIKYMAQMKSSKARDTGQKHSDENMPLKQTESKLNDQSPLLTDEGENNNRALEQSSQENQDYAASDVSQEALLPTCNLCSDPSCTRKKGEPSKVCIKYKKKGRK